MTAAPPEAPVGWDSGGQCMCTRRFRSSVVEAEYLAWHFGIWGRRTRWFAAFATAIVLANLALVLAGGSTRRAALDFDGIGYLDGADFDLNARQAPPDEDEADADQVADQ